MKKLLALSVPAGLILCGAGITSLMFDKPVNQQQTELPEVNDETTYYLFVSEIEVFNQALDGSEEENWDSDDDAPDLFYEIEYQNKRVFKSPQRDDTFIGNWRGITLPIALQDLTSIVKGDINLNVDFEQIVDAARVKGRSEVTIKMFDHDTITPTDDIGKLTLSVSDLEEGTNVIHNPNRSEDNGWKSIQIKLIKREGSVKDYLLPLLREMTEKGTE